MSSAHNASKLRELRAVFEAVDTNGSGELTATEMRDACDRLGLSLSLEEAHRLIDTVDDNGDGVVNFDEFLGLFDKARLRTVFDELDDDRSGTIDAAELGGALSKLGVSLPRDKVAGLLSKIDTDNSGSVDFDEFCAFFDSIPALDVSHIGQILLRGLSIDTGSEIAPSLPPPNVSPWTAIAAGGAGGAASRSLTAPLDRITIMAQTNTGKARPTSEIFRSIVQESGVRGLFKGNGASVLRVIPFSGLVCLSYGTILSALPADSEFDKWEPVYRFGAGGTAGAIACAATYPLDMVRARLAVQSGAKSYTGIYDALTSIAKEEGIRGMYKGIRPTLLAIGPFIAVQQSSYDVLKQLAAQTNVPALSTPSVPLFLGCGVVAGVCAQVATHPIDLIRRRMQVMHADNVEAHRRVAYTNTLNAMKTLIQSEGIGGMFRGVKPACMKVAPAVATSLIVRDAVLGRLA